MNIYFILFIIVIPFTIFFITLFSDREFKKRLHELKNEVNIPFKTEITLPKSKKQDKYYLNNGIGFGFGKEFFSNCEPKQAGMTEKQRQQNKRASIGIKFHKFKMNHNYNTQEIDDVVLKDYCSEDYLEKNFVNVLNNLWFQSGVHFYLRDIINEDEVDNLTKYYLYDPRDDLIYPKCEDIVNFKRNPIQFSGEIPEPIKITTQSINDLQTTSVGSQTTSVEPQTTSVYDAGNIYNLFSPKDVPELNKKINPEKIPIPPHITRKTDDQIKDMASLDIYLLQRILSQENILNEEERKNTIRNIFFRMTDETQYLDDKDLHIYLVPYIEDDFAFVLEGRNSRPLIVLSMYHKDCNKMEKVLENVNTSKTCGDWISRLLSNYNQLRNTEQEYNKLANIDIVMNPLNNCGPGVIESSPKINSEIQQLRDLEKAEIKNISSFKQKNNDVVNKKKKLNKNISEIDKLLNYDYKNDHQIKVLKNYKNRRVSRIINQNGSEKEITLGYNELVKEKLDQIKNRNEKTLSELYAINKELQKEVNNYNKKLNNLNNKLNKIQETINLKLNPKAMHVQTLTALKEKIDKVSKEISSPMYYAKNIRNVLNINLIIVLIFGIKSPKLTNTKLIEINKNEPICNVLQLNLINGGITKTSSMVNEELLNNKSNHFYLNIDKLPFEKTIRNVILAPKFNKNGLFKEKYSNKCSILGAGNIKLETVNIPNAKMFCEDSKYYETGKLNALDINAQYYLVNEIINKVTQNIIKVNSKELEALEEFKKKIEFECTGCKFNDNTNYRAEPSFIKSNEQNKFFSNEEAIKNYEWLAGFIVKNRLIMDDDFVFYGAEYLNDNSNIFTEDLINKFFPKEPIVTDAIPCNILDKDNDLINVDTTLLNDYILKSQSCNNKYINSFKDSYI